jgi:hypothetical protein
MNKLIYSMLIALGLSMGVGAVHAAKPIVGGCGKQAGDRKGEEMKKFMKECVAAQRKEHDSKLKMCRDKAASEPSRSKTTKMIRECMAA